MHIGCKPKNMDMRNMYNIVVELVIQVKVEVLLKVVKLVEDEDKLSAITMAR